MYALVFRLSLILLSHTIGDRFQHSIFLDSYLRNLTYQGLSNFSFVPFACSSALFRISGGIDSRIFTLLAGTAHVVLIIHVSYGPGAHILQHEHFIIEANESMIAYRSAYSGSSKSVRDPVPYTHISHTSQPPIP